MDESLGEGEYAFETEWLPAFHFYSVVERVKTQVQSIHDLSAPLLKQQPGDEFCETDFLPAWHLHERNVAIVSLNPNSLIPCSAQPYKSKASTNLKPRWPLPSTLHKPGD